MKGGKERDNPTDAARKEAGGVYLAIELSEEDIDRLYDEWKERESVVWQ
jgi:hypothetical protein